MKKLLYTLGFACIIALSGCGGVESQLEKLQKIQDEIEAMIDEGNVDEAKMEKLQDEKQDLLDALEERRNEMNDQQIEKLDELSEDLTNNPDKKIDRLESIKKEMFELDASNAEDQQKIAELSAEVSTIATDLDQLDKDGKLSDEHKERLTKIMLSN